MKKSIIFFAFALFQISVLKSQIDVSQITENFVIKAPIVENPADKPGWSFVFRDEFEGSALDETEWLVWDKCNDPVTTKWYAEYHNVSVSDGKLHLLCNWKTSPYTCGDYTIHVAGSLIEVNPNEEHRFTPGHYFEIKAKLPRGEYFATAFFTYSKDKNMYPPVTYSSLKKCTDVYNGSDTGDWKEVDIWEHPKCGNDGLKKFHSNTHAVYYDYENDRNVLGECAHYCNLETNMDDFSEDYYTIGVLWDNDQILWYVNNQLIRKETDQNIIPQNTFGNENKLYLVNGVGLPGGSWEDSLYNMILNNSYTTYEIEYVRVYERNTTSFNITYPDQYYPVGDPSMFQTDGDKIYYINDLDQPDGQICALNSSSDAILIPNAPKSLINGGLLYSNNNIYYIGYENNKIYKMYYDQLYGWQYSQVCPNQWNNTMLSSDLTTDGSMIFYINTNRDVCALYYDSENNCWADAILNSSATKSKNLGKGLIYDSHNQEIYYTGEDNYIYYFKCISGNWESQKRCPTQFNSAADGYELVVDNDGYTIFYVNTNGYLCSLHKTVFSPWQDSQLVNYVKVKPGSHITFKDYILYYIGDDDYTGEESADYNVYRLYWNGTNWQNELISLNNFNTQSERPISGIIANGNKIYFTGQDNYIHDFTYSDSKTNLSNNPSNTSNNIINTKNNEISSFKMYPNPTSNIVTVNLKLVSNNKYNIKLINILGKNVYSNDYDLIKGENSVIIETKNISNGIYNVIVSNGSETKMGKLIVNH